MILNSDSGMTIWGGVCLVAQWSLVGAAGSSTVSAPIPTSASGLDEPSAIEEIVVTGARREVRVSEAVVGVEVLSREAIEASGAEDLAELLEGQPGLQIERTFAGASIRIHGLDPEHTLVLIDGLRVNGRINGVIDLQRITAERIERVEIVKGAASALYGSDALAGVVNIITRAGREPFSATVHGAFGSLSATTEPFAADQSSTVDASARVAARGKKWEGSLTGGFHRQDAFDLSPQDAATSGSELTSYTLEARGVLRFSDRVSVATRLDYFERRLAGIDLGPELPEVNDNPFVTDASQAVYDRRNEQRTFSASVQPQVELSQQHDLQFGLQFSRYDDVFELDQRNQDRLDSRQDTTDDLVQLTAQYVGQVFEDHLFTAGMESQYERLTTDRILSGEADRGRVSLYLQDEWRPIDGLAVVPGVRLDVDTQFGTFPTPKLAVRYDLTSDIVLRGSYGFGFRAPGFRDLYLDFENRSAGYRVLGNPDLEPETSRSLTFAFEASVIPNTVVRAEFYRNDVSNLIAFLSEPEVVAGQPQQFTNGNIEAAVTQGVETSVVVQWLSFLRTDVSYTYLDARDDENDRFLEARARHRLTFNLRAFSRQLGLHGWVRGTYVGERPFYSADPDDPDTTLTTLADAYVTIDARVSQDIGEHFTVFVGVDNLLNAGDPQFLAIPPFGLYGGLNARL